MSWTEQPMVLFDVESTGVDVFSDRIVTASLIWRAPGQEPRVREWLINPGVPIPAGASAVHGIADEQAAKGMDPEPAIHEIVGLLGITMARNIPVVIMNAAFDLTILQTEAARHGVDPLTTRVEKVGPILDPLAIDRALRTKRGWGGRKLDDLCDWYGVINKAAHDSTGDCHATGDVLLSMSKGFPDLAARDPWDIHDHSVRWHAEWAAGFSQAMAGWGKDASGISGEWPIRVTPPAAAAEAVAS